MASASIHATSSADVRITREHHDPDTGERMIDIELTHTRYASAASVAASLANFARRYGRKHGIRMVRVSGGGAVDGPMVITTAIYVGRPEREQVFDVTKPASDTNRIPIHLYEWNWSDYTVHRTLSCTDHPDRRWSSKNPLDRSVFYLGKVLSRHADQAPGTEIYDSSVPGCGCPFTSLVVIHDPRPKTN